MNEIKRIEEEEHEEDSYQGQQKHFEQCEGVVNECSAECSQIPNELTESGSSLDITK